MVVRQRLAERVQRIVTDEVPVLHVEPEIPAGEWALVVDGLVGTPISMGWRELHGRPPVVRYADMHCVWGWSRPASRWEGAEVAPLLAGAREECEAVLFTARGGRYASCFTLAEARECLLAWRVDGADLAPERGFPLRLVPPASKWAYKAVKWVERITLLDAFTPGEWERRVGDPHGTVPWPVLQRFDVQTERYRGRR